MEQKVYKCYDLFICSVWSIEKTAAGIRSGLGMMGHINSINLCPCRDFLLCQRTWAVECMKRIVLIKSIYNPYLYCTVCINYVAKFSLSVAWPKERFVHSSDLQLVNWFQPRETFVLVIFGGFHCSLLVQRTQ